MAADPCDCISLTTVNEIIAKINLPSNIFPDEDDVDENVENILREIAETGFLPLKLDWKTYIMPFIALKIHKQFSLYLQEFGFEPTICDTFENRRAEIFDELQSLDYPPFTVQRLVELILDPKVSYKSTHKLMNGVLKLLSVTSSHEQKAV